MVEPEVTRGMLLGKFMPLHRGHLYAIDFARRYCDELTVLVCSVAAEPIDGGLRYRWVRESCPPEVGVVDVRDEVPQEPSEHPDFWEIWRELVWRYAGRELDFVFASEAYGERLAGEVGARFVPVDVAREVVPVSATAIRADPLGQWEFLPPVVRAHYAKRVCVFGPESTGKTTLTFELARRFQTRAVHEYARPLLASQGGECGYEDIEAIGRGQIAAEEALSRQANRVLFCDTDTLTTVIWSDVLFGKCPQWIREEADRRRYDLTLLLDVDVPWVEDPQRYLPEGRREFFERCEEELKKRGRPYVVIRGSFEERLERAVEAVQDLL